MKTYLKAVRKNDNWDEFFDTYLTLGKTYEAEKLSDDLFCLIDDEGDDILTNLGVSYHGFDFEEVEESNMKTRFKIGDKVKDIGGYYINTNGGYIGVVQGENAGYVLASFPNHPDEPTKVWYYKEDELELLEGEPEEMTIKCKAQESGLKKVVITEDVGGWGVGTIAWMDPEACLSGNAYNDDMSDYWSQTVGHNCEWVVEETEEMTTEQTKEYKTWGEMTPEEKGALLLAHHEGKVIEYTDTGNTWWAPIKPQFLDNLTYRVKPEIEEEVFDEVYLEVSNVPYTYSKQWGGTTKGQATVTYTDGKPAKMVWTSTEA